MEEDDLDQFSDLEDNEGEPGSDGGDAGDAPPAGAKPGATESKRVDDLTSKWQKAEARAAKAEKALAAKAGTQGDAGRPPAADPERDVWIEAQREFARERALNTDSRLAEYGFTADDITGNTPADMKASVKRAVDLIDAIETKVRNRLLIEHGLSAEVPGGRAPDDLDIASMDDKDFEKLVRRTKSQL